MSKKDEYELDVAECIFEVQDKTTGKILWSGESYEGAFLVRNADRENRKVMVKAKVDVTLEEMGRFGQAMLEDGWTE